MKKTFQTRALFLLSTIGFSTGLAVWAQPTRPVGTPNMVREIKGYSSWTVANDQYVEMEPRVAGACATFPRKTQVEIPVKGTAGPHDKKWLRVYVNAAGKKAMLTQKYPNYPVGTVIVKEKRPNIIVKVKENEKERSIETVGMLPELLTVMIKHEANYDKANGDWEFMVTDGKGEKVTERGKLPSCQGCHKPYEKTDYVVRSYLPVSVMKSLKDLDEADTPKSEPAYIEPAK